MAVRLIITEIEALYDKVLCCHKISNNMGWFDDITMADIVLFVSTRCFKKNTRSFMRNHDCKDTGKQYDHLKDTCKNKKDSGRRYKHIIQRYEIKPRSREVHDSCHIWMQRPETTLECFQVSCCLIVVKLSRGIREVDAALWVIVIFGPSANNVSI